jgi:dolichol-phosphate mannosyltransferase
MENSLPFNRTLLIIPTYNEIDNIERMIEKVFTNYPTISLLIIDDGSPDGTKEVVKHLQEKYSSLHLIERSGKLGLGTAYARGFAFAIEKEFEFVVQMDCDFSHDPKEITNLLKECQNYDLIIGSRYINGIRIINWSFRRLLLSYLASIYIRIVTGIPVFDTTGGYKCMRTSFLKKLNLEMLKSNGYIFQLEINYKAYTLGKKIKEVPIIFYERTVGVSKMDGNIIFEALYSVVRLRVLKMLGKLV